jgi:hypothetical protein
VYIIEDLTIGLILQWPFCKYKILVLQKTKNIEQNWDKTEEKQTKRQDIEEN